MLPIGYNSKLLLRQGDGKAKQPVEYRQSQAYKGITNKTLYRKKVTSGAFSLQRKYLHCLGAIIAANPIKKNNSNKKETRTGRSHWAGGSSMITTTISSSASPAALVSPVPSVVVALVPPTSITRSSSLTVASTSRKSYSTPEKPDKSHSMLTRATLIFRLE